MIVCPMWHVQSRAPLGTPTTSASAVSFGVNPVQTKTIIANPPHERWTLTSHGAVHHARMAIRYDGSSRSALPTPAARLATRSKMFS